MASSKLISYSPVSLSVASIVDQCRSV